MERFLSLNFKENEEDVLRGTWLKMFFGSLKWKFKNVSRETFLSEVLFGSSVWKFCLEVLFGSSALRVLL
ncbi:hypothetical protein [Flavobacterium chungangensis]|uniref:Uncharacterized protein n=1 Tax=Flavobacterium chungangensis TaxID=2708132 RepID=A0ABV8Z7F8_9FLAO